MRIKVAIVGSGYIAIKDYYPVFSREDIKEKMEVSAICDVVPGRAEEHCKRFGFGIPYTDYDKMLSDADIDVVAILSPIPYHYDQIKKALNSGKHVYVQKTMTVSSTEAIELNSLAKNKGLILCASPGQMIEGSHVQAQRILDSGKLGKVCFVRGQGGHVGHENLELEGINPAWYYKRGGGPMMDVAVYPITSITGLIGPAKRVTAFSGIVIPDRFWNGNKLDVEMDDTTVALLDFGDNVFASVHGNFCTRKNKTPQIEIFCEKGVMMIGGWSDKSTPLEIYCEEPMLGGNSGWYKPLSPVNAANNPYTIWTVADLIHTVDCVSGLVSKPRITGEHAAHVIEIIEKSYESAQCGRTIELKTTFEKY